MITAIQFIAAVIAALIGVFVTCLLLNAPITLTHFTVTGAYWSLAVLAYLLPRSASRVLRTRLLACALILTILAYGLFLYVEWLRFPIGLAIIFVPLFSILVFCFAAFLTGTRRSWTSAAAVLITILAVHFIALWWSYGFQTEFVLKLVAVQLIPLFAATASLLATDRLIMTGDNPTKHSTLSAGAAEA